jgi:hypothetical protein
MRATIERLAEQRGSGTYPIMRSTSLRLLFPTLLVGVVVGACLPEEDPNETCGDTIIARTNPNWDFSNVKTFAVVDKDDYPVDRPSDLPRDAIPEVFAANSVARDSLIAQGLVEVNPDFEEPDVWLFSMAATHTEVSYTWECVSGYMWWGWNGWDFYCQWSDEVPFEYEVGTVVVGLAHQADENMGEIVFGGAVQGVLFCEDPQERLAIGVAKIFAQYPTPEPEPAPE